MFISFFSNQGREVYAYQLTQAIRFLSTILMSIIVVRSGLPISELGNFELFLFVFYILSFSWSAGLLNAFFSYKSKLGSDWAKKLPGNFLALYFIFTIVFGSIVLCFQNIILPLITSEKVVPNMHLMFWYMLVTAPTIVIEGLHYLEGNIKRLLNYSVLTNLLLIISFLNVAIFVPSVTNFLYILLGISSIKVVYLVIYYTKKKYWNLDKAIISNFFLYAIPVIGMLILGHAMEVVDGLFAAHFFSKDQFPIFRYGAKEIPFSTVLFSSLSMAMIPFMNQNNGLSELKRKTLLFMHYLFPISYALMIFSPFLFEYFYGKAFLPSSEIFNIYLLIITSRVILPQTLIMAKHQYPILLMSSVIELIVNIVLSIYWVQKYGLNGLAMATVIAFLTQKIILVIYNKIVNQVNIQSYVPLRWYLIYSFCLVALFIFINYTR